MGKKRIAFVLDGAIVGGIETSLIQMLRIIDTDKYEVFLFTNFHGNPCIGQIPECIKVFDLDDLNLRMHFWRALKRGALFRATHLLYHYIRLCQSKTMLEEIHWSIDPFMFPNVKFDCAIAYKQSWKSVFLTLYRIKSKKSVVWVHGKIWGTEEMKNETLKNLELADRIFCVSVDTQRYINDICPETLGKSEVLYNLLDSREIVKKAGNGLNLGSEIALVTVGRLSSEKGQEMIPQTARFLLDAGYTFKWYIIGDGPLRATVEEKCREYDVTENVIFMGTLSNPYPYIKSCDIYVQTSYSEGYCTTTMEAKILGKTIVTTDAPGMREQFVNGVNGLIVKSMTPEALFEGIKSLLDDPALCRKFMDALNEEKHDNSKELEKLYAFIES